MSLKFRSPYTKNSTANFVIIFALEPVVLGGVSCSGDEACSGLYRHKLRALIQRFALRVEAS
jgi:hypothetical protein